VIALLQRVRSARVEVDDQVVGAIDAGLLAFVCAEPDRHRSDRGPAGREDAEAAHLR
jgi:D-Tyr-tRNAtyr deacylase